MKYYRDTIIKCLAMNDQKIENPMGREPIGRLLLKFAVPSCISLIVNALYNIVDQIFIGRGVGYLGNGATNVILPLVILNLAICILFGDGCAAYFSMQLGRNKKEDAAAGVGNAVICGLIVSIILCVLFQVFLKQFCCLAGATDNILPYALEYGRIIVAALPGVSIVVVMGSIIRADGSPNFAMAGLLVGCGINVLLDYIFVFPLQMGVKGAAWATVIGELVNAAMFFIYLFKFKCVALNRASFRLRKTYIREISRLGVSSFATQMAAVVIMIVMNQLLVFHGRNSKYGADIPMTAMGVTMKINQILLSIMTGIGAGALPIIGFNYGAKQYARAKQTMKLAFISAMLCGAIATFFFQVFPEQIVSIFGSESAMYVEFSVKCLRIYLALCVLDGINNVIPTCLQAVERPGYAVLSSMLRQIVFNLPPAFIIPLFLGVTGVLGNGPVATAAAFLVNIFILRKVVKSLEKE